jgi:hypothetical protein
MTEMVLKNGVSRVDWQLKSLFQARQGVSQEKLAENSLLEMFRMGWGMHCRELGTKGRVSLSGKQREQVIFQINILWK